MRTKGPGGRATGAVAAIWLAAWANNGYALGLSEAQIRSSLGDRLDAEITLYGDDVLQPRVEARVLNNDRQQPISLRTTLEPSGDQQWTLHIRTAEPLWEPALNITVEVADGGMRVQRAIAVLLDPPPMTRVATREREPAAPAHAAAAAPQPAPPATVATEAVVAASEAPAQAPAAATPAKPHGERPHAPRRTARDTTARAAAEPLRRFQLTSQLSMESLALIQDGPTTSEVASADTDAGAQAEPASPATPEPVESSPSIDTALIAAAVAAVPPAGSAENEQAVALANEEREARINAAREAGRDGFFLLAPFKVFFALALLATLLFGQAGRLRRQMMDQFEQPLGA